MSFSIPDFSRGDTSLITILTLLWMNMGDTSNLEMICNKNVSRVICMIPGSLSIRASWYAAVTVPSRFFHALAGPASPSSYELFGTGKPGKRLFPYTLEKDTIPGPFLCEALWQASERDRLEIELSQEDVRRCYSSSTMAHHYGLVLSISGFLWALIALGVQGDLAGIISLGCSILASIFAMIGLRYYKWEENLQLEAAEDKCSDEWTIKGKRIHVTYASPACRELAIRTGMSGQICRKPVLCAILLLTSTMLSAASALLITLSSTKSAVFILIIQIFGSFVTRLLIRWLPSEGSWFENAWRVVTRSR